MTLMSVGDRVLRSLDSVDAAPPVYVHRHQVYAPLVWKVCPGLKVGLGGGNQLSPFAESHGLFGSPQGIAAAGTYL